MNEPEKSDKPVVPMKPANSGSSVNFWEFIEQLEQVEGRGLAKENEEQAGSETGVVFQAGPAKQADRTQSRLEESVITLDEGLHSALERVRQAACRDKFMKFTSLWHHVYNIDRLREAYFAIKRNAKAGVDGETWQTYGQELESNLKDLSERLVLGTYRAKPVKRVYIPKADGRKRPIGIPVLAADSSGTVARGCTGHECCLRDRLPRLLVWIPTGAQRPHGIGCPGGRDSNKEGELVARRGHSRVLRHVESRMAH
jgi:hypothetical protein